MLILVFLPILLTLTQSKYELTDICILYTDPELMTDVITLIRTTNAQKKFLYYTLMGLRFWLWNFHQQGQGSHSREVREFFRGSGKVREIWFFFGKSQWRVKEENFYPWKFLTFKKSICMQKCVQLNCRWQSVVYMMLLFASNFKMI